jgi:hypothetical protein
VELDELHVDEVGTRPQRERVPVAGVLPGVRGDLPRLADTAGGQDDRRRLEDDEPSRLPPIAERAGDAVAVLQQPGDRALHEHRDLRSGRPVLESPNHLQTGAVAHVGQPGVAVATEVALQDAAVRGSIEQRAPLLELQDPLRSLLGVDLRHAPVRQHLPATHRVPEVHLPAVLGVDVAECGRDAAFGHHRVRLAEQRLAHHGRPRALRGGFDRGSEAGPACTDDHDVEGVGLVVGHQKNLRSRMVPVATSRMYRSVKATPTRLTQAICM